MNEHLIIALDFSEKKTALEIVDLLGKAAPYYKVGMELYLKSPEIISELKERQKKVFLDLKFHDIPNTVSRACAQAASMGIDMVNVHALGGSEMMRRALEGLKEGAAQKGLPEPILLAVTILTSMDQAALYEIGLQQNSEKQVLNLARLAQAAGLGGVVSSPREALAIKEALGQNFVTVCPGIRTDKNQMDDQKRTMGPGEAIASGVDYLVTGRPITRSADPLRALAGIVKDMEGAQ